MNYRIAIRLLALIVPGLLASGSGHATSASPVNEARLADAIASIETLVEQQMAQQRVPGVSVALIDNDEVVYAKGFGVADRWGRLMSAAIPSALGSVSKSFTAVAIMQLVDEEKLELDQPVAQWLPLLAAGSDERLAEVTVRQLLMHTSGFSTYSGNFGQADYSQRSDALERSVARLAETGLSYAPLERFEYSNANYQVLGALLEHVDSMPFEQALQTRVLDRIGMSDSFVLSPDVADRRGDAEAPAEPHRYWLNRPVVFEKPTPRTIVAQGGVFASTRDTARYLQDLLSPQPTLLSVASRNLLFRLPDGDVQQGYGLGWFVERRQGAKGPQIEVFHSGLNVGYEAMAGFVPDRGQGFVVVANAGSGFLFGDVGLITEGVMNIVFQHDAPAQNASIGWIQGLVLLVLNALLLLLVIRWSRRLMAPRIVQASGLRSAVTAVVTYGLPIVLLIGLAGFVVALVPRLLGLPLDALAVFAPDAGVAMYAIVGLALLAALIRGLLWWGSRRGVAQER